MRWLIGFAMMACSHAATSPQPPPTEIPATAATTSHAQAAERECTTFDPTDPACKTACPPIGTADCKCPEPPDPNLVACQDVMPCPTPPDRRVKRCRVPSLPGPIVVARIVVARIVNIEVTSDGIAVVIAAGRNRGVDEHFHGRVLAGDTATPLAGGELTIVRVDAHVTRAKLALTRAALGANMRVELTPD